MNYLINIAHDYVFIKDKEDNREMQIPIALFYHAIMPVLKNDPYLQEHHFRMRVGDNGRQYYPYLYYTGPQILEWFKQNIDGRKIKMITYLSDKKSNTWKTCEAKSEPKIITRDDYPDIWENIIYDAYEIINDSTRIFQIDHLTFPDNPELFGFWMCDDYNVGGSYTETLHRCDRREKTITEWNKIN